MKNTSHRTFMLALIASICLAATASAGPGFMMMIHGKMMMVTPMEKDMTLKNGTKVMMNGTVMMKGKKMKMEEGDAITPSGEMMKAAATKAHGG